MTLTKRVTRLEKCMMEIEPKVKYNLYVTTGVIFPLVLVILAVLLKA